MASSIESGNMILIIAEKDFDHTTLHSYLIEDETGPPVSNSSLSLTESTHVSCLNW